MLSGDWSSDVCSSDLCLSTDELTLLAADLVVLSDMLANLAARKSICEPAASAEDVP